MTVNMICSEAQADKRSLTCSALGGRTRLQKGIGVSGTFSVICCCSQCSCSLFSTVQVQHLGFSPGSLLPAAQPLR